MTTSSSSFITLAIAGVIVMVMMLSNVELMLRRQDAFLMAVVACGSSHGQNFLLTLPTLSFSL